MAAITKVGTPTISTLTVEVRKLSGLVAGEDIGAGDACYIKASDGKIWKSIAAAINAASKVRGYAAKEAKAGEPCTLVWDVRFNYGSGLTPGASIYLSEVTAGALADAVSTVSSFPTQPIGYVVDAKRVHLVPSVY